MRLYLIRVTQALGIGMICASLLAHTSHAEKMSPANLRQLCKTAGGTFSQSPTGIFACSFPSTYDMSYRKIAEDIYCNAQWECELVTWCDRRPCGVRPLPKGYHDGAKKPGPKPKPTKLEGALTAGTADQRGAGVSGGMTAGILNPNLGASSTPTNSVLIGSSGAAAPTNSSLSGSTGPASGTPAAPTKSATGISKPSAIPAQLAERLRRLQQQQR